MLDLGNPGHAEPMGGDVFLRHVGHLSGGVEVPHRRTGTIHRAATVSRCRGGLPERGDEQPAAQAARTAHPGAGRIGAGG